MEILGIYDKNSNLKCYGKNIFDATRKYLSKYPDEYSEMFNKNIENLKVFKVDKLQDETLSAVYDENMNVIHFSLSESLGHEIFHMASNDVLNNKYAFLSNRKIEYGLIEGMTEYACMQAYGLSKPGSYPFEVFTAMMLDDVPNLYRSYFIPSHVDFINLFPNKRDIYGLLYSLNAYNFMMLDYLANIFNGENNKINIVDFEHAVRYTITKLIAIELSIEKDCNELKKYADRFMDLITSDYVYNTVSKLYPGYIKYANKEIKERVRSKR